MYKDLVTITWDEDAGVVDIANQKILMSCYASRGLSEVNSELPKVNINDSDFKLIGVEPEESNWDDVPRLLLALRAAGRLS